MPEELPRRETIAAVATPPGRGGIGVVRVSGHALATMATALLGQAPRPRHALLADFLDAEGSALDRGLALYFRAPHSLTGEDVLELQGHGGPVVMQRLLARACELGARLARPGEFTERAFLNDKIDLAQAEAVADLVDSASQRAARSAMRSLSGEFSERVGAIDKLLLDARVHVEAAIDFAEEEIDFLADSALAERLDAIASALDALLAESRQGPCVARWSRCGDCRRAQCGQVEPAEPTAGRGPRHRHGHSRHDPRPALGGYRDSRHSRASHGHGRAAGRWRRRGGAGHRTGAGGDGQGGPRAGRRRRPLREFERGGQPTTAGCQ